MDTSIPDLAALDGAAPAFAMAWQAAQTGGAPLRGGGGLFGVFGFGGGFFFALRLRRSMRSAECSLGAPPKTRTGAGAPSGGGLEGGGGEG